eukprot:tig00021037_g17437.t1
MSTPGANDHHCGSGFRNPPSWTGWIQRTFWDVLVWNWNRKHPDVSPATLARELPQVPVDWERLRNPPKDRIQVTWIGHASMLVQVNGVAFLTDPVLSQRCSPLSFAGPKRLVPPAIAMEDLGKLKIDFSIVSHNHYDHLDLGTVKTLGDRCTWVVPLGLKKWFSDHSIANCVELDWWQEHKIAEGVSVTCTPCQHWSSRTGLDRNKTLWSSFLVKAGDKKVYFGGDTGYCPVFKEVGKLFGPIDLAILPIGAYEPRWFMKPQHIDPDEAVQIHLDLDATYSVGMHWGTFVLTDEPIGEPPLRLAEALRKRGIPQERFFCMKHGEVRILSKRDESAATVKAAGGGLKAALEA